MYSLPPLPHHDSDSNRHSDGDGPPLRLYQVWSGRNRFLCKGRLIFGPDVKSIFLTVFLILGPVILFSVFVSRSLINELQHPVGIIIAVIGVLFGVWDITLLFLTSGRDPGIIPRNPNPPEDDGSMVSADWPGMTSLPSSIPPTKGVVVNGFVVRVKYCNTCQIYRPPRCSHCSICNNCVDRFDHHCPWVGQCIGKRNYRFFFMFVSSTTLLALYVFIFSWVNVAQIMKVYHCTVWGAFMKSPVSGFLITYTFVAAWFVGGLSAFHLYLICTNQTTYENFRYRYDGKMNPYHRGCGSNMNEVFCSEIPPSKHNFREEVKMESSIYGNSMSYHGTIASGTSNSDAGSRKTVHAAEDLEDIESQTESVGGLMRCGTLPREEWDNRFHPV